MSGAGRERSEGERPDDLVVRKGEHGWVVGEEEVSDLTSAMVLADIFASEHEEDPAQQAPPPQAPPEEAGEAERLAVTVQQLEHALASRVQVEQAIGVLAERNRLQPRAAFDLLRGVARAQGRRLIDMAGDVVASAANPLLRLPDELARKVVAPRPRGRSPRRAGRPTEQQAS
jgi:ANTAR domain